MPAAESRCTVGQLGRDLMRPQLDALRGNSVTTSTLFGTQTECVFEMVPPHLSILSSMHGIDLRTSAICGDEQRRRA